MWLRDMACVKQQFCPCTRESAQNWHVVSTHIYIQRSRKTNVNITSHRIGVFL